MARKRGTPEPIVNFAPVIEMIGIKGLIEQVGLKRVIDEAETKDVVEALLAKLSPKERADLRRRLD